MQKSAMLRLQQCLNCLCPYNPYRFMQQALLADRFKLKVHFETRLLPIYALVVAKGGPKLKASEMDPANPAETVKPAISPGGTGQSCWRRYDNSYAG